MKKDTTLETQKYEVIYADPPWKYDFVKSKSRKIENKYPTMDLEEIKNLQVPSEDNCILFMWATAPKLEEAFEVINAWGFKYKTCAVWDKESIGMGYWFRGQHEILLVATKGKMSPPPNPISSIIKNKRREHSRKPDFIRTLISTWYPNETKIEMFSRSHFEGWNVFGNQIPEYTQKILK